jgi:inward rectifier potassium channel
MAKVTTIINTGLDNNSKDKVGRLFNKNGLPNVIKRGVKYKDKFSIYHTLLSIKTSKFLFYIFLVYLCINLVFALVYYLLGAQHLGLATGNNCGMSNYLNCFFFSAQTLTTVGYGRLNPLTFATSAVSAIESLIGLLMFALITGLSYGRFSKPKGNLVFSEKMLLSKIDGKNALAFRMISPKTEQLADVTAGINCAILEEKNGQWITQFYPLKLQINKIETLALNWTVVHLIDDDSPLINMTLQQMVEQKVELLVFVQAFDEHYSNIIKQRTSYTSAEIIENAKFKPMFYRDNNIQATVLEINKLNDIELINA